MDLSNVPVLDVQDLHTQFFTDEGIVRAVDGVSFSVNAGETLGIVGESGSGKSVTALSVMRLLEDPARITQGRITVSGRDVLAMGAEELRRMRGGDVAMVFQDPDDVAQPGAAHRPPARGSDGRAWPREAGRRRHAQFRCSRAWASPRPSAP